MSMALVKAVWESGSQIFRRLDTLAGAFTISPQNVRQWMSKTDFDNDSDTLTAAAIVGGIAVHTCGIGGGTLTTDTAANILAAFPGIQTGELIKCYVINDGAGVSTLAGGVGVTLGDAGQTLAADEAAELVFLVTSSTTLTLYHWGA